MIYNDNLNSSNSNHKYPQVMTLVKGLLTSSAENLSRWPFKLIPWVLSKTAISLAQLLQSYRGKLKPTWLDPAAVMCLTVRHHPQESRCLISNLLVTIKMWDLWCHSFCTPNISSLFWLMALGALLRRTFQGGYLSPLRVSEHEHLQQRESTLQSWLFRGYDGDLLTVCHGGICRLETWRR